MSGQRQTAQRDSLDNSEIACVLAEEPNGLMGDRLWVPAQLLQQRSGVTLHCRDVTVSSLSVQTLNSQIQAAKDTQHCLLIKSDYHNTQ